MNNQNNMGTQGKELLPGEEMLRLDNQLCFALYVCSKEIIKKYKPILEPLGLTYTGYITMLALWEEDGLTVKDLGNKLYLDSGTLTPLLKKLEAQDYITRIRSSNDERNVVITLTEKGQNLKSQAIQVPHDLICSVKFDMETITDTLGSLHGIMELLTQEEEGL
ncbi:MarR family transcriptional regulator [Anaerocolumna sp. AGMB13020]|uniref:MarR family winged helix-turn-helix transcriptional regulator n=1 Tax=Anaerocolumna sp. AGMB13020 TaxID=3081750 RepID=UPI0029531CF1|nr:MarR family transcriptional regulator [Anaerocolumna sp. AGMB13020]WOO37413.1 MarR family transcriptional regulator [Anaerocolumna sp. AGMB13020]